MKRQSEEEGRLQVLANRYAAWVAGRMDRAPVFSIAPEPLSIGTLSRGKRLLDGHFDFAGHRVHAPGKMIWDLAPPDPAFAAEAQGFGWLEDLAALGTPPARSCAQDWTMAWIRRYGRGRGMGWRPDLSGRRLLRWLHHSAFLLHGQERPAEHRFMTVLARQTEFLARRAAHAPAGLPRFEALSGLLCASLSLDGMARHRERALHLLETECDRRIDAEGGIPSRNPEELLEILQLLVWVLRAYAKAEEDLPTGLSQCIDRIAPCLRVLRHADGGLARFHDGGRGIEGRLEQALAASAMLPPAVHVTSAMGYIRLSQGRSTVIVDAAAPPDGPAAASAHASTSGFELTSGRRRLIVSCGAGRGFGAAWRLACRATQSHSALSIDGVSSSRFTLEGSDLLEDRARVTVLRHGASEEALLQMGHDGWVASHGLTCWRELHLSPDGRRLRGVDALTALGQQDQARFGQALSRLETATHGLPFTLRFHLHPDVDATIDRGGTAVSLELRSGEIWIFRHDSAAKLTLEPSAYLEKGQSAPRSAQQIVLLHHATDIETRIGWTLAKAQDTPLAIRDLDRDDPVSI